MEELGPDDVTDDGGVVLVHGGDAVDAEGSTFLEAGGT